MQDEFLIAKELPSGASCYIIPKKGYASASGMVCTRFGSMDMRFAANGKVRSLPAGAAHFLEHKLFESAPGKSGVFERFAQLGAEVNAFTNFGTTAYYFTATSHFEDCLRGLLDFVYNPYLTDENVEKEKGIITQEIRMYDDDPFWTSYFGILSAVYKESPVRVNIAGTAESVTVLTKEMLLDCHDVFYRPAHMAVICAGEFEDVDGLCELIDRCLPHRPALAVSRDYGHETADLKHEFATRQMSVSRPVFHIGIKDARAHASGPADVAAAKIVLDLLCGEASVLFADLFAKGLVDAHFYADYQADASFGVSLFAGESDAPQTVYERVIAAVAQAKKAGFSLVDFERVKRKHMGRFVRGMNSTDAVVSAQSAYFAKRTDLAAMRAAYENVTMNDIAARLDILGKSALSVVE